MNEATRLVCQTIADRPITYIMVDALDECNQDLPDLVASLKGVLQQSSSLVKIFVTSREYPDIQDLLNQYPDLCIDASQNQADIELYVKVEVESAISKKKLLPREKVTEDLRRSIGTCLREGAMGM